MKQKIEAVKEQLNDVHQQLDQANETISLLSEQLEDVTSDVETEVRRITENLKAARGDEIYYTEHINTAIADLTKLVEAI